MRTGYTRTNHGALIKLPLHSGERFAEILRRQSLRRLELVGEMCGLKVVVVPKEALPLRCSGMVGYPDKPHEAIYLKVE